MTALPPMEVAYQGERDDAVCFSARLIFDHAVEYLPLRVSRTHWATCGHEPRTKAGGWVEREFRRQYEPRLQKDRPVVDQIRAWSNDPPLWLIFAEH
jgi:hypothetical protein